MPRYHVAVERKYKDVSIIYVEAPSEEAAYTLADVRAAQTMYDDPPEVRPEAFRFEVVEIHPDD